MCVDYVGAFHIYVMCVLNVLCVEVYLHLGQLADHFYLLLQDPPQGLLGCGFIVVFILLERKQLLLNPLLRLGLEKRGETRRRRRRQFN